MKEKVFTRDILILLSATFFYSTSPMLIAGFSESMGMNAALAGMMTGIMYLSSLFCLPVFGRIADLKSKGLLMKYGLILMAASVMLTALSVNSWMILAARLLNGAGYCLCSISITAWLAALFPRNRMGTGMGCYGMVNALANAIAPMIALQISQTAGCRAVFWISFISLVISILLISLVREKGDPLPGARKEKISPVCVPALPFSGIIMCFTIPFYATTAFLAEYTAARGLNTSPSIYFLVYAIALLILRTALKDQFDRLLFPIFFWSSLISSAAACALLFFGTATLIYTLAGTAMAAGCGLMSSVCQSASILAAPADQSGLAGSTFYIGIDLGLLIGPGTGGEIIVQFGMTLLYPLLALVLPGALLIFFWKYRQIASLH